MHLQLDVLPEQVLRAAYHGKTTIDERRVAKLTIGDAATAARVSRVLIDLTGAEQEPYASIEMIGVASRVLESSSFGRLAYVVEPGANDAVAGFLAHYQPNFCRVFHDQKSACDWLAA